MRLNRPADAFIRQPLYASLSGLAIFWVVRGYHLYLLALGETVKEFTAVVEKDPDTGLYVGHVPGFPGAHSQGESLDELNRNLAEVIEMLLEDGEPKMDGEFVGTQRVRVG